MTKSYAACITIADGEILLMRRINNGATYYSTVGGGVEDGETVLQTAQREAHEESSLELIPERTLLTIHWDHGYINTYVLCTCKSKSTPIVHPDSEEARSNAEGIQMYFPEWVPIHKLDEIDLKPRILKTRIQSWIDTGFPRYEEQLYLKG